MNTLTPHQRKALDFQHSVSLSANAGSGKTFVLAKRYLRIALEGNVPLRKIAAITFTDKAAGELYKKIADEIDSQAGNTTDPKIKSKLGKIRRQLVSANISTIHSFCLGILREFPVEANLDANFTAIDTTTSQELLELSIEELTKEKLENTDSDVKYLIRIFSSRWLFIQELRKLIWHRKIVISLKDELYKNDQNEIIEYFNSTFEKNLKQIVSNELKKLLDSLRKINDTVLESNIKNEIAVKVGSLLLQLDENKPIQFIEILSQIKNEIFTKGNSIKKAGYLPSNRRNGLEHPISLIELELKEISELFYDGNRTKANHELASIGKAFIRLFDSTIDLYDKKKKELEYLDYEDILIKVRKILTLDDVKKSLTGKFNYLMVDEYQDTNDLQYQIFMPILDYLKTGNLFIVGDEKQSIYRFRDAELEVFSVTNEDIRKTSGDKFILTLPDSFRMYPVICLFTNVLFRTLFKTPLPQYNEVGYTDLICARDDKLFGSVSILLAEKNDEITESNLVANQVLKLYNEKSETFKWKDFAVLVRKRSAFKELEQEFINLDIPYSIIGGKGFYQRQSIYDIYNYFSFLLDIENDAALTGLLRSPFYSFSDLQLFSISLEPGETFWEKLNAESKKDKNLSVAVKQLSENIRLSGEIDSVTMIRKMLSETTFISVQAAKPDGDQELANIEKLIQLTIKFTNQGFRTLFDYVNYLKNAINKLEEEAQAGLPSQTDAVNILTLHQAKGLEFPVVFLFKCDEAARFNRVQSRSIRIDKKLGILTKVPIDNNYFAEYKSAPIISIYNYIDKKKTIAEIKRLFYVGVTRAEKHVYLSGTKNGDKPFDSSSFLSLLMNGLNLHDINDQIVIEDDLTFLKKNEIGYNNKTKHLKIKIPVIRNIETGFKISRKKVKNNDDKTFKTDEIEDKVEGEIISATKVATYNQCPLKYKLIYLLGYSPLNANYKEWSKSKRSKGKLNVLPAPDELEKSDADIMNISGIERGRIIHKILQMELTQNKIEKFIEKEIEKSPNRKTLNENSLKSLINELSSDLNKYYNSNQFADLNKYNDYKNEFEVYLNENGHFLYGIIDKLIFTENKIIIVDYKTDDIEEKEIESTAQNYFIQLKFYVYIVSKLFLNYKNFEIRIVFIKYPDSSFNKIFVRNALDGLQDEIEFIIKNIALKNYDKNITHCIKCGFTINNSKCIIQ